MSNERFILSIIERIAYEIECRGLKSVDLAVLLNVNPSVISTWKSRNKNPPSEYVFCICEFLGVSPEWLLTGEGSKHPAKETDVEPSIWELQGYQRQAAEEHYSNLTNEQAALLNNYEKLTLPNRREVQAIIHLKLDNQQEGRAESGTA